MLAEKPGRYAYQDAQSIREKSEVYFVAIVMVRCVCVHMATAINMQD
jgi:hypothetical protein